MKYEGNSKELAIRLSRYNIEIDQQYLCQSTANCGSSKHSAYLRKQSEHFGRQSSNLPIVLADISFKIIDNIK